MKKRILLLAVGSACIGLALTFAFRWVSHNTSWGIFVLGGGKYWVRMAAESNDDALSKQYLARVLSSNQYGVNTAENAVVNLADQNQQYRLFMLLAEIAPNTNWKEHYHRRANQFRPEKIPKGDFGSPGLSDP